MMTMKKRLMMDQRLQFFQVLKVLHEGCVNRIRAMKQRPRICATWGDTGHVQHSFKCFGRILVKFTGHKDEGYAIDWSPLVPGRLVSGDCRKAIHLWEPASDLTWNVDNKAFVGHTKSVEDLQFLVWSPTEQFVFAPGEFQHDDGLKCGHGWL
nr:hypothetical protein [Tanacetum cinerariifolium]